MERSKDPPATWPSSPANVQVVKPAYSFSCAPPFQRPATTINNVSPLPSPSPLIYSPLFFSSLSSVYLSLEREEEEEEERGFKG